MFILMGMQISALVFLYPTVDEVLRLAGKAVWDEFIVLRRTDLNYSNELHRMQDKVSECRNYVESYPTQITTLNFATSICVAVGIRRKIGKTTLLVLVAIKVHTIRVQESP